MRRQFWIPAFAGMIGEETLIFVFGFFAVALLIAAFITRERGIRWFLIAAALLNTAGIIKAVISDDPYAYKLRPASEDSEPNYRRP